MRRGLVLKAHRLLYHSTLGSRVMKKKKTIEKRHAPFDSDVAAHQLRHLDPGHPDRRLWCQQISGYLEKFTLWCHQKSCCLERLALWCHQTSGCLERLISNILEAAHRLAPSHPNRPLWCHQMSGCLERLKSNTLEDSGPDFNAKVLQSVKLLHPCSEADRPL